MFKLYSLLSCLNTAVYNCAQIVENNVLKLLLVGRETLTISLFTFVRTMRSLAGELLSGVELFYCYISSQNSVLF